MKKFRKVYVEITNICNMNCSFCPETQRAKAFMNCNEFEHVLRQIVPFTDYVYLHVKGEPMLHPHLEEILSLCEKYKLKVNISTNGTLLKDKYQLLKNIRQLNVSLHSFEKEDAKKLEEYINYVLDACNKLAKHGVIIRYKLWNADKNNDNSNLKIIQMLNSKYNADVQNTVYDKDKKLKENVFLSIKTPFKWPSKVSKENRETTCYGLRSQIAILVDGTVVPCCVDNDGDINLGNVFDTNLETILNSDKALRIRKGFEDNKCVHELCKKCEYRTYVI